MSAIIIQGYGENSLIITQGYSEIGIIPPFIITTKPMHTEEYHIKYIDVTVKVPVEKLSVAKEDSEVIDVSQIRFGEEPLMSWSDIVKFSSNNTSKKHNN